jgi:hypothetical protein
MRDRTSRRRCLAPLASHPLHSFFPPAGARLRASHRGRSGQRVTAGLAPLTRPRPRRYSHATAVRFGSRLFELPGVDPPTKEVDPIVGPGLIARHRAVLETSQDGARVLRDVVVLPEIELRDAQHRRAISFPEQRLHVLLEARPSTLDAGAHAERIPPGALDQTSVRRDAPRDRAGPASRGFERSERGHEERVGEGAPGGLARRAPSPSLLGTVFGVANSQVRRWRGATPRRSLRARRQGGAESTSPPRRPVDRPLSALAESAAERASRAQAPLGRARAPRSLPRRAPEAGQERCDRRLETSSPGTP